MPLKRSASAPYTRLMRAIKLAEGRGAKAAKAKAVLRKRLAEARKELKKAQQEEQRIGKKMIQKWSTIVTEEERHYKIVKDKQPGGGVILPESWLYKKVLKNTPEVREFFEISRRYDIALHRYQKLREAVRLAELRLNRKARDLLRKMER